MHQQLPQERLLVGGECLSAATELLQRARAADPVYGLYEAADLQWWWRQERKTDAVEQLFWFDEQGRPEAAIVFIDWGDPSATTFDELMLAPLFLPDATPELMALAYDRALVHAASLGVGAVDLEVDRADATTIEILTERGFARTDDAVVEAWMDAAACPDVSALADGFRLTSRQETSDRPHHMISEKRNHGDPVPRLTQTSLYRPDLDLVVLAPSGASAAYGLFWFDPVTRTGMVEPMRTEDEFQKLGLARYVLTAGVNLLVSAGAERIKICYEPGNPASGHLYRSAGFVPTGQTDSFARVIGDGS